MRKCVCSRAFLMSFFCTVLVLLFVFGMLMVDAEGRRLSFNDNAPPAEMLYQADGKAFLKINAFELDARIPVTGAVKVWRFFEKFFCLPQSSNGEHGQKFCSSFFKSLSDSKGETFGRAPQSLKLFCLLKIRTGEGTVQWTVPSWETQLGGLPKKAEPFRKKMPCKKKRKPFFFLTKLKLFVIF